MTNDQGKGDTTPQATAETSPASFRGPRFRLILFVVLTLISSVPLLFLATWVGQSVSDREYTDVAERHLLLAKNLSSAFIRYVQDVEKSFETVAIVSNEQAPSAQMGDLLRSLNFERAWILDPENDIEVDLMGSIPQEGPIDVQELAELRPLADEVPGRIVFSDLMRWRDTPVFYLLLSQPEGRLAIGILRTDYLVEMQKSINFGRKGHSMIVDHRGRVIAHPKEEWQRISKDASGLNVVQKMMAGETGVTQFYSPPLAADMIAGHTSVPKVGWGVMVPQPISELDERAEQVQSLALMISIAGILCAVALSFWLSKIIASPIEQVVRAAGKISEGDLGVRVATLAPTAPRELKDLALSFNSMVRQLGQKTRDLEGAVSYAKQASKAKSEFLANMSHEIRTPMNGVLGMTEVLGRTELSERQRRLLGTVRHSAESLLDIINEILDFSRIEAGKLTLETVEFDARQVLGQVLDLFAEEAENKSIKLHHEIDAAIPKCVMGDRSRVRQILTNLIGNAVKFTDEGHVTVTTMLASETEEDLVLRFEVKDTGIGIDSENRETLFEPFQQADASTTRKYGGTGLGLTISKQLVQMMGGAMGIDSEPQSGTVFWFTLPLGKAPDAIESQPPGTMDFAGTRLLIVDDNPVNREILEDYATEWRMFSESAANGRDAMSRLRASASRGRPFDLVILDRAMPGMDGATLARRIEDDPDIPYTRLIMLSSIGGNPDGQQGRGLGISAIVEKPIDSTKLREVLTATMVQPARQFYTAQNILSAAPKADTPPAFGGKILVAEDHPVNQEVARELLTDFATEILVAEDGHRAIEIWAEQKPALIFMDCQMPGLDGFQVTQEIRRRETEQVNGPRTIIVALTAHAFEGDRDRCLEAGMDDYIRKPYDRRDIANILFRWFGENEEAPLDREALWEIRDLQQDSDPNVLERIINLYLGQAVTSVAELIGALKSGDLETAVDLAHGLRSSSANVGAHRFASICEEIESKLRDGAAPDSDRWVTDLELEFGKARVALESELSGSAA